MSLTKPLKALNFVMEGLFSGCFDRQLLVNTILILLQELFIILPAESLLSSWFMRWTPELTNQTKCDVVSSVSLMIVFICLGIVGLIVIHKGTKHS